MARTLRVLQLVASLSRGGGERLVVNLAQALPMCDIDVHLCAFGNENVFGTDTLKSEVQHLPCSVHLIRCPRLYDLPTLLQLKRYIEQEKIDLIHTHLSDADIIGNVLGRWLNIPVVTTLQNVPHQYEILPGGRAWLMRHFVAKRATRLVAISESVCAQFVSEWQVEPERIETIHNAIVLSHYLELPLGTRQYENNIAAATITTIGRLEPQKAQHNFLHAAKIVLEKHPHATFQLVGEGSLKGDLIEQATELGILDNVHFLGLRDDIANILASSDIFVLTSLWEGLPLSAIEAMAAGRPQILSDVGGNRELIDDNVQGIIVPPNNIPALVTAIDRLLSNQDARLQMGKLARERAAKHFSIHVVADRYSQLYRTVCKQHIGGGL